MTLFDVMSAAMLQHRDLIEAAAAGAAAMEAATGLATAIDPIEETRDWLAWFRRAKPQLELIELGWSE
jgi:hypothetical protein